MIIVACAVYALYWIVESFHDDKLRLIQNMGRGALRSLKERDSVRELDGYVSSWHKLDFLGHFILAMGFGYVLTEKILLAAYFAALVGSMRVIILNIVGNILAKRKLLYLGDNPMEKWAKGKNILYYLLFLIIFIVTLYLITKELR